MLRLLPLLFLPLLAVQPVLPRADLVLKGGVIYTMNPAQPRASALAVKGGRIIFVGNDDDVAGYVSEITRVIELHGRAVTPGLVDGHAHLLNLGKYLENLQLKGSASAAVVIDKVAAAAKSRPAGEWIVGRGWDQNLWTPAQFPDHSTLDGVAPNNPVALRRVDGHALWANAAAMRAAGISKATPDPAGGKIVRDGKGELTGIFLDNGVPLIESKIPKPSREVIARRLLLGADAAVKEGLTGIHDMGMDEETVSVYRELAAAGKLKLRVYGFFGGEGLTELPKNLKPERDRDGTSFFTLGGIKLYADGALGSRGAALLEPYSDDPKNRGLLVTEPKLIEKLAKEAAAAGWQVGVHAIGDRANRIVLDAYEKVPNIKNLRFRIEHAQVISSRDIPRFGKLGVIAAMQPTHATSDMGWAEARLGPKRILGAYAWRSLLDSGARLVGGSDFPVEEVSPLLGIHAAIRRQDEQGKPPGGWYPKQRMELDEAIRLYTSGAAFASLMEKNHGRISPGFIADLTIANQFTDWNPDICFAVEQIDCTYGDPNCKYKDGCYPFVHATIVGGRFVYERKQEPVPADGK
jgi:hypothetical protein